MAAGVNDRAARLIRILADGEYHSGEQLGAALGISRAAVWKQLKRLEGLQLEIEARAGTGYRLRRPLDLYERERLTSAFDARTNGAAVIEIADSTGSTSSDLLARVAEAARTPRFLFAEHQGAGRGRHGRTWVTPFAGAVAFSMLRRFERAPAELGALSLVAGLSVVQTLSECGVPCLGLKWPNDLVHRDARGALRKLGGILIEMRSEAQGPSAVVIGCGINYALPPVDAAIDQPWIDLQALLDLSAYNRSELAGALAAGLANACDTVERQGTAACLSRWSEYDMLRGQRIDVHRGAESFAAVANGIDEQGALLVQTDAGQLALLSGEVSVRKLA